LVGVWKGQEDLTNNSFCTQRYDAAGNRIFKQINDGATTLYVRDASGNVMSVYGGANASSLKQTEVHLYGSSRLGIAGGAPQIPELLTLAGDFTAATVVEVKRGEKFFEWSNNLGNVLVTVSEQKIVHSSNSSTIDYYTADVISAQDYYPFGMIMPGRASSNQNGYRYGFNGKENDKETGSTTTYDYGFRIYNPALGKFLSVDPLTKSYPWYTPYQFAGNKPVWAVDLDGLEEVTSTFFKAIFGSPAGYAKPKTALDQLNKDRFAFQKNFAESRTGRFLGGAANFTLGTIGTAGSIAYIGGTDGAGAAFGGSLALQFSLGEMTIGVTQMFDAFSSKNMNPFIHEAGSIPGLIAYGTGTKYAPFFDALGQFTPTPCDSRFIEGTSEKWIRGFRRCPDI
jgi:RHS repeat-associated protein